LTGEGYFAGLWREGLEFQLLWLSAHWNTGRRDEREIDDGERVLEHRAPTWSWAALDHPIDYRDFPKNDERVPFMEILDV
jgi:hypothetical protein